MSQNRGRKWEDTHGGLRTNETSIDGIIRELNEELGVHVLPIELSFLETLKRNHIFRDIFILKKDISIDEITFKDDEVMNCKYVTLEEFKKMIINDECTFKKFEDTIFYKYDIKEL